MVLEDKEIIPFFEWLQAALGVFAATLVILFVGGIFLGFLAAAARYGPGRALASTFQALFTAVSDLFQISPRRVWAMTTLAFREAIRRKVLVVFGVFLLMLLFAGWFLDPTADHPGKLYVSFVLTATNFLIVMLAVFLSTFSLPNDVKNRTIYTVVTKPVRAWEIVMGRIFGFTAIGTLLLVAMTLFSYVFVVRGLQHTHAGTEQLTDEQANIGDEIVPIQEGFTTIDNRHRHEIQIGKDGVVVTSNHDHIHEGTVEGGNVSFGSSQGNLLARVPKYGKCNSLRGKERSARELASEANGAIAATSKAGLRWLPFGLSKGLIKRNSVTEFPWKW